ncbi:MAG: YkgJ family cysteine cluster protein [Myxococcota bacterium]
MVDSTATHVRPFRFRAGARYQCFGDGLCCSDIHALGPLTRRELVQIRRLDPAGAGKQDGFDQPMLLNKPDGSCVFQLPDRRCGVHAQFGYEAKPGGCRRFPLGLVATPRGGRVTTEHRCPCRTMGERPELTPDGVQGALKDDAGRLVADRRVERVSLDARRRVSFDRYATMEQALIGRLLEGEPPEDVVGAQPFPRLRDTTWRDEAELFVDSGDTSQFGVALQWFGDAVLSLRHGRRPPRRDRPWAQSFARSRARTSVPRRADEVLADWLADEIWSLRWVDHGWSFERARREMATRLAVARHVLGRLRRQRVREDQAAAEAVMVIDMLAGSEYWIDVVDVMRM